MKWHDLIRGIVIGVMLTVWSIEPLLRGENTNSAISFLVLTIALLTITYLREKSTAK